MVDVKMIPAGVLNALRKRERTDEQIAAMSPREVFNEYCTWHGLIGWGDELYDAAAKLREQEPKVEEVPHIVVWMEGGIIQGALSAKPVLMSVIDYDTEDCVDEDDLTEIPQQDGEVIEAYASVRAADINPARAAELIEAVAAPTVGERRSMKP
jgi:hypothetical protein